MDSLWNEYVTWQEHTVRLAWVLCLLFAINKYFVSEKLKIFRHTKITNILLGKDRLFKNNNNSASTFQDLLCPFTSSLEKQQNEFSETITRSEALYVRLQHFMLLWQSACDHNTSITFAAEDSQAIIAADFICPLNALAFPKRQLICKFQTSFRKQKTIK